MSFTTKCTTLGLSAAAVLASFSSYLHAADRAVMKSRVAATQQVGFDVYLPLQHRDDLEKTLVGLHDPNSASYQKWLTPEEFNTRFSATPAQVQAIQRQLNALGLGASAVTAHHLHVTGTAAATEKALGTVLQTGQFANGQTKVMAMKAVTPTSAMAEAGAVVTGLSRTLWMRPHSRRQPMPDNRYSATGGYWFTDLKQAYAFPSYQAYTGKGSTIGILMSSDLNITDMNAYFGHEKLATPNFSVVKIDGGAPFDPTSEGSFEANLDLQQSGGMAPKAKIILYDIPDLSDDSIIDGLSKIVSDNKADVVSMSFGLGEIFYTAAYNGGEDFTYLVREEDDLMAQGNAQGITFVASSGDAGALGAVPLACFDGGPSCGAAFPSAETPATSPHVVAVGGTNLVTTYTGSTTDRNSAYVRESAYADPLTSDIFFGTSATGNVWGSGGGDSILFSQPPYQALVKTGNKKARTVPDLALNMGGCPQGAVTPCNPDDSYDLEVFGGLLYGAIGTSASAPDFAGLVALQIERFGTRLGNANYYIYTLAAAQEAGVPVKAFRQGIPGYNGFYSTTAKGYNRVLGNGTLNGANFLLAPLVPKAGTPQTPSNP